MGAFDHLIPTDDGQQPQSPFNKLIPAAPAPAPPSYGEDIQNVAPSALRTGAELVPAGPAEMSSGAPWIVRKALEGLNKIGMLRGGDETLREFDAGYKPYGDAMKPLGLESVRENITDPLLGKANPQQAQTGPGKLVQTGLETAPSMVLNPGSAVQKGVTWLGSTLASEGAGQGLEAAGAPEWAQNAGRLAGGFAGGFSPSAYNRMASPHPMPPGRAPQVRVLESRGVPITAGQRTGSKRLMAQEEIAGGVPAAENQGDAFTGAVLNEQGGFPRGTTRATRPVMRAELDRMGGEFDRLGTVANPAFDTQLQNELLDATISYHQNNPLVAPVIETTMNKLAANAAQNGGRLTGTGYQNTRSEIGDIIRNESTDPGVRQALLDFQDALDDGVSRYLSPEDQAAMTRVRGQYRNFLPIERARAGAGSETAQGLISPTQLRTGIKAAQGRREVAAGGGPLTDLAEAGTAVLEKTPQSGTQPRLAAATRGILPAAAAIRGSGGGMAAGLGGGMGLLAGSGAALATVGLPMLRDAYIRSPAGQAILARQLPRVEQERQLLAGVMALARTDAADRASRRNE